LKVCFVGLGSIGMRHVENLSSVCDRRGLKPEIHALRSTGNPLPDAVRGRISRECHDSSELDKGYDAIFLTNPTDQHYRTLKALSGRSNAFFIEKPVFDDFRYDLGELDLQPTGKYYIACPLRFTGVIAYLKRLVESTTVFCARVLCSSFLPEWRPGKDYRSSYSASRDRGGGVRIDLIHEWDYVIHLFGFPREVKSLSGRYSGLELESEDVAAYVARYDHRLVEIHVDYFGRVARRTIELFTDDATITGDIVGARILFSDRREPLVFNEGPNEKYLAEMEYFLDVISGRAENINTIEKAVATLETALS
jgi:predicted dehydrogenase